MKKQLLAHLAKIVRTLVPSRPMPSFDSREEPLTLLPHLDADTVAGILVEAENGIVERLFTLYRDIMVDSHLLAEFSKRKLAVLKEQPVFIPYDKTQARDVAARDEIERMWGRLKGKREALTHLLDSSLHPVSLVEKVWKPSPEAGRFYDLAELRPVPHHLLDYRDGEMKIRRLDAKGKRTEQFYRPDPVRFIIHRGHLLTSFPDKWGGPMRAVLFWFLFKTMSREWWVRFLDRFGAPFLVGKYNDADERSRSELAYAFHQATRIFGLVIPQQASVEMVQAATSQPGDAFANFHAVANGELSKLIVGQTMTTEATAGGIGGTQATVHQAVRDDIQAFDSSALAETLRDQLFDQHLLINGFPGGRPSIAFGGLGAADAKATAELLKALGEAGFEPGDDAEEFLSRAAGFPVRRKAPVETGGWPPISLSADPSRRTSRKAVAEVSRLLRDKHARLPELVTASASAADLEDRLIEWLGETNSPAADAIADALTAHAIGGLDRAL